jgi:ammonia channel protein AmtB
VHFVGGVLGTLLLGFFAERRVNATSRDGLFYGGGGTLLWFQVVALVSVVAFSFILTWVIALLIERTIGLRMASEDEDRMDMVEQGMPAYPSAVWPPAA